MGETVRLSQCMIVKNEEKNIEKALSWGKGIVCEQIVVDTGSTDRTVEIAESMGAKVYHFQWVDDFSAAKNFAIEKAAGNWIAFLDADEYFGEEDARKILPLLQKLQNTPHHAVITSLMQLNSEGRIFAGGTTPRLFKNIPGLHYRNRIHEELYLNEGRPVYLDACKELSIFHTGYSESAHDELNKAKRNLPLVLKELEAHPDNYHMMGFLGDCYSLMNEHVEARKWFEKAVSLMPDNLGANDGRSSSTLLKLMFIYLKQENIEKAVTVYQKAISLLPEEPDFDFVIGQYYARKKAWKEGAYYLKRALDGIEQFSIANRGMLLLGKLHTAWELLAECHYENGSLGDCVSCTVALLKGNPYRRSTLELLLKAFMKDEQIGIAAGRKAASAKEVLGFLSRLYDLQLPQNRAFVLEAAETVGYTSLAQELKS